MHGLALTSVYLEPVLGAVPVGGLLEALIGRDLRPPQFWRAGALGLDHPIAVREISGAVDRELGFGAAEQLVGARGEAQQDAGRGDDRGVGADRLAERASEFA